MPDNTEILDGRLKFYSSYIPSMEAGHYTIELSQEVKDVGAEKLSSSREVIVSGPQFQLDDSEVDSVFPPHNHSGLFENELPHIVLESPSLPWDRMIEGERPWLALLVFSPSELVGGKDSPTLQTTMSVGDFSRGSKSAFRPGVKADLSKDEALQCNVIRFHRDWWKKNAPRLAELEYTAHVREVDNRYKSEREFKPNGRCSVIIANRFPEASHENPLGALNICHLVSLQGMGNALKTPETLNKENEHVELISLASWSFRCLPNKEENFSNLMLNLAEQSEGGPTGRGARFRMPTEKVQPNASSEVKDRFHAGFTPMPFHTRSGEKTVAWYRGPLVPEKLKVARGEKALEQVGELPTNDAGMIYDEQHGVFDLSYSAAWQLGKWLALRNEKFGHQLLAWRKRVSHMYDLLCSRLAQENITSKEDIEKHYQRIQSITSSVVKLAMSGELGTAESDNTSTYHMPGDEESILGFHDRLKTMFEKGYASNFVVYQSWAQMMPIVNFMARKYLLYDIPFRYLVPRPEMIPNESIRFFYLDTNWFDAMAAGMLSLGVHSSRDSRLTNAVRILMINQVHSRVNKIREVIANQSEHGIQLDDQGREEFWNGEWKEASASASTIGSVAGFLLKSSVVSGWPGLEVKGENQKGEALDLLRLDHLSDDLMLGIFNEIPATVYFQEPGEGLRFGAKIDGEGKEVVYLRNLDGPEVGKQQDNNHSVVLRDQRSGAPNCMRSDSGGRVLNLDPNDSNSLVAKMSREFSGRTFSSAALALQMVRAPYRQNFKQS